MSSCGRESCSFLFYTTPTCSALLYWSVVFVPLHVERGFVPFEHVFMCGFVTLVPFFYESTSYFNQKGGLFKSGVLVKGKKQHTVDVYDLLINKRGEKPGLITVVYCIVAWFFVRIDNSFCNI
jgi:hypothetical protein